MNLDGSGSLKENNMSIKDEVVLGKQGTEGIGFVSTFNSDNQMHHVPQKVMLKAAEIVTDEAPPIDGEGGQKGSES